ncbi:MAG: hypothetical protein A2Y34_09045 [Spirochaetes bacterium GWC1_27_15]|nr:MAG: hypothetical protein A2Y34_09045 [Spirochaetes bacterium GWC1_27_15]
MFLEATANYFLKNKQYEKSVFYFYRLHQLMPNDLNTLLKLIDLFELRNFTHQVLIHLEKMHKLNPTNEHIAFYYSYHLIKRSNFNEAIKILKNIEKDKEKSYYLLSEVYFKIKDNKKGFFFLKKTFDLNPLYLPTQFKSLIYFYKNNNFLQSVRLCKLIEYTNSSFKRVLIYESIIYCKKGRIDLAINRLEKYLIENKEKDNPYIKFMLSCCYYTYGMTEKSEKLILHLIKKNQLKAPYLVMLALCYKRKYKNTELKRIEYILTQKFGKSPSFLEYKSKYLTIDKSNNYKRKDIGVRIP